jgi:hypothetical protein
MAKLDFSIGCCGLSERNCCEEKKKLKIHLFSSFPVSSKGSYYRMSTKRSKYTKRSKKLSRKQLYGLVVVTLVVVSLLAVYSFYAQPTSEFKAVLVDQLSLTWPNATFTEAMNNTLKASGYSLTYNEGSEVGVDFYRDLPTHGYKVILLRVHSALRQNDSKLTAPLDLFTSEPYSNKTHLDEQIPPHDWLDIVFYPGDSNRYFGITDSFVYNAMRGSLQDAVVILMGCNGMDGRGYSRDIIGALVYRGAKVVIGWNDTVSAYNTDIATEKLLNHLLLENKTIKNAVDETNNEVAGQEKAELLYYPSRVYPFLRSSVDVSNYTIPHGPQKSAASEMSNVYVSHLNETPILALPLLSSVEGLWTFNSFRRKPFSVFHNALKP